MKQICSFFVSIFQIFVIGYSLYDINSLWFQKFGYLFEPWHQLILTDVNVLDWLA